MCKGVTLKQCAMANALFWLRPEVALNELLYGEQCVRRGDGGHAELMLQWTRLLHVKRRLTDQDGLTVLNSFDRSHTETAAIPSPFHLVQHRHLWVP